MPNLSSFATTIQERSPYNSLICFSIFCILHLDVKSVSSSRTKYKMNFLELLWVRNPDTHTHSHSERDRLWEKKITCTWFFSTFQIFLNTIKKYCESVQYFASYLSYRVIYIFYFYKPTNKINISIIDISPLYCFYFSL